MGYKVAVVGVTGAVGQQMLNILFERKFPVSSLVPLSSARSAGKSITFGDKKIEAQLLGPNSFEGVQIALFSAGKSVSQEFVPIATKASAWVVDNTSAFRMNPQVPLVVPEVNAERITQATRRIIANPNCTTIQMVVALNPIRKAAGIKRIVVATYQAVAGAGRRAISELETQMIAWSAKNPVPLPQVFPHQILFECLPQIGQFDENGDSEEEQKMVHETRKIFDLPNLRITATTVRVPVLAGHSEAVNIETEQPFTVEQARAELAKAPGVQLVDNPREGLYPLAQMAQGTDPVYVGRIRKDLSVENGLNMWVVADNLRKGAALNAVQIAEILVSKGIN
ncbi:MAG: aspartate-semialdehyde dehydrogenase [Pseudomonadota bacterium]